MPITDELLAYAELFEMIILTFALSTYQLGDFFLFTTLKTTECFVLRMILNRLHSALVKLTASTLFSLYSSMLLLISSILILFSSFQSKYTDC